MKLLAAAALLGALSFAGPVSAHAEGPEWYQISPPANCATMNEATHGLIHDPSDIALLAHLPGAMKMTWHRLTNLQCIHEQQTYHHPGTDRR